MHSEGPLSLWALGLYVFLIQKLYIEIHSMMLAF